jgi:hypothetical protein
MRVRLVLVGTSLAALGAFLMVTPVQTTSVQTVELGIGQWMDLWVPPTANILGGTVQIQVVWGAPPPSCAGYCVNQYWPTPFALDVSDCGMAPCSGLATYPFVDGSDFASFAAVDFSAHSAHHYKLAGDPALGVSGVRTLLIVSTIAPWLGGAGGLTLLVAAVAGVGFGLKVAAPLRPTWPAACGP